MTLIQLYYSTTKSPRGVVQQHRHCNNVYLQGRRYTLLPPNFNRQEHMPKKNQICWKHTMMTPRTSLVTYHPTAGYIFHNYSL